MAVRSIDRKLSMSRDRRRLSVRTQATQLVLNGFIVTSTPKARVLVPYIERLTAKAKAGNLAGRRYVRARLDTVEATNRLVDVIAPQTKRESGFVRKKPAGSRAGDGTPLTRVEFVDEIKDMAAPAKPAPQAAKKPAAKTVKKAAAAKKPATKSAKTGAKK